MIHSFLGELTLHTAAHVGTCVQATTKGLFRQRQLALAPLDGTPALLVLA